MIPAKNIFIKLLIVILYIILSFYPIFDYTRSSSATPVVAENYTEVVTIPKQISAQNIISIIEPLNLKITYFNLSCVPNIPFNCATGVYTISKDEIEIATNVADFLVVYSLVHEIGHHFWYVEMSQSERDTYINLTAVYGPVNEYGKQMVGEDFADYFAILTVGQLNGYWNHIPTNRNQQKEDFLNYLINLHPEYSSLKLT